jgi:hypothetical protein
MTLKFPGICAIARHGHGSSNPNATGHRIAKTGCSLSRTGHNRRVSTSCCCTGPTRKSSKDPFWRQAECLRLRSRSTSRATTREHGRAAPCTSSPSRTRHFLPRQVTSSRFAPSRYLHIPLNSLACFSLLAQPPTSSAAQSLSSLVISHPQPTQSQSTPPHPETRSLSIASLQADREALERFKKEGSRGPEDDAALWHSRTRLDAVMHPDTGEPIHPAFRFICPIHPWD